MVYPDTHDDPSEAERTAEMAELRRTFLFGLFVCLRNIRMLGGAGESIRKAVHSLHEAIVRTVALEGTLALGLRDDVLMLNDHRLRAYGNREKCQDTVMAEMAARQVRYIEFTPELTAAELADFLELFVAFKPEGADSLLRLTDLMADRGIEHVVLDRESDLREMSPQRQLRAASARAYLRSIQAVRRAMDGTTSERVVSLRQAGRLVMSLVDVAKEDQTFLMALGQIKNHDEYTYNHCVNVCTYALSLGNRLNLDRAALARLGLAALFHDLGKTRVSSAILAKPGRLDEDEWQRIRMHPEAAVGCLARCHGDRETMAVCLSVALEHHRGVDGSGYGGPAETMPNPFSRIVMIADIYDALTTPRVYRPEPWSPIEVFGRMLRGELGAVDRDLLKLFIAHVGLFPVGSLVRLDDARLAMVCRPGDRIDRPTVRIMDDGIAELTDAEVDLEHWTTDRPVAEVVSPREVFTTPERYLQVIEML